MPGILKHIFLHKKVSVLNLNRFDNFSARISGEISVIFSI